MDEFVEPKKEESQPVQQEQQQQVEQPKQEKPKFKLFKKKEGPGFSVKLKEKFAQYKRTIEVARKPGKEEFLYSAKITGIGIALLGVIGFVIFLVYRLVV